MYSAQDITIRQVSNGWMVVIPIQPEPINYAEIIRAQARVVKDEMNGDDLLKQLQSKSMDEPVEDIFASPSSLSDLKDESISIFKTFDEVLAFLKSKI